ncbi:hypothetical protein HELRODRAFT_137613, partial [Helobdella robusta]|uniref:RING-type domain-containing protein n=1 Tax=Helobdella robusta TaxID=6412 RepID=T1EIL7_HELRO
KVNLTSINKYITCSLCGGYYIDATAIVACQHTFCRSCILLYLQTSSYCPVCDRQVIVSSEICTSLSDTTLQMLVYKLLPNIM